MKATHRKTTTNGGPLVNALLSPGPIQGKAAATEAHRLLLASGRGFIEPTARQKRILKVEFAKKNKVVYGRAFDLVRIPKNLDLSNAEDVARRIPQVRLYEVKSTGRANMGDGWATYFFSLSTAELLTGQSLKDQYRIVFVNVRRGKWKEMSLRQVFRNVKEIYPSWSIKF